MSILVDKLIDHSKTLEPKESGVKIPFADSINHGIGGDDTEWSMTVMDRTIRYLAIITKVNMDSRPRIIDTESGKFYPISTFTDFKETLQLMRMASSVLRPYISYWYNQVFLPRFRELGGQPNARYSDSGFPVEKETYVGLTTEQLANKTLEVMKIPITTEDIRRQYLYPLSNLGIINIVKSSINRNELICFPVEDGSVFNIFDDEQDLRLKITNNALFPSKNLLEENFRTIVKHDASEGVLKINDKFRLVDSDGIDITIGELIERYLSDPLTCFKTDNEEYDSEYTKNENENNLYPFIWRRDLTEIPNNNIEEFSNEKHFCQYCKVTGYNISYDNEDTLVRHHVNKHKGWSMYSEPDIIKFKAEYEAKKAAT